MLAPVLTRGAGSLSEIKKAPSIDILTSAFEIDGH
jgi:hypothetical protein